MVVSVNPAQEAEFLQLLAHGDIPVNKIGIVSGADVQVNNENWGALGSWKDSYEHAINPI